MAVEHHHGHPSEGEDGAEEQAAAGPSLLRQPVLQQQCQQGSGATDERHVRHVGVFQGGVLGQEVQRAAEQAQQQESCLVFPVVGPQPEGTLAER